MAILGTVGRSLGSFVGSKKVSVPLIAGSLLAGFVGKGSEGAVSNMMDVSFGTPDADNYMLGGRDLTPSMAMGALAPGFLGTAGRIANVADLGGYGTSNAMLGGMGVGALAGTGIGAYAGIKGAGRAMKTISGGRGAIAKTFGGAVAGITGALGPAIGGAIGAGVGAGVGAFGATTPYRRNKQLFNNSPYYNTSLSNAERLNASGDIVLGMHNSRRG
jgi:hypothetical protein